MKTTPKAIVKLANTASRGSLYDQIRGKTSNGGHHPGLLEQQHPIFWKVPLPSETVNMLCNTLPKLASNGAEERVLRSIVGHTWRYQKAGEFITWKHFLKGKFDSVRDEVIVAPARVSGGTLTPALQSATRNGLLFRHEVHLGSKALSLYLPNPLASGGSYVDGRYADPDIYVDRCTYPGIANVVRELRDRLTHRVLGSIGQSTRLHHALVNDLRTPELIVVLLEHFVTSATAMAATRKECLDKLLVELHGSPDHLSLDQKAHIEDIEAQIELDEMTWFCSEQVVEMRSKLRHGRDHLNAGILDSGSQPADGWLATALIHRWGVPLISLNSKAWTCAWRWRNSLPDRLVEVLEDTKEYVGKTWYCALPE